MTLSTSPFTPLLPSGKNGGRSCHIIRRRENRDIPKMSEIFSAKCCNVAGSDNGSVRKCGNNDRLRLKIQIRRLAALRDDAESQRTIHEARRLYREYFIDVATPLGLANRCNGRSLDH